MPDDLAKALNENPQLLAVFERMRASCQRQYSDWVTEAKRPETRERRTMKALEMVEKWGMRHPLKPSHQRKT